MVALSSPEPVNLDHCDREPIHIPGHIQGHGALLAFDGAGVLRHASGNAGELLAVPLPMLGERVAPSHFDADGVVLAAIAGELAAAPDPGALPRQHDVTLAGRGFHLLLHRSGESLVAEIEPQAAGGAPQDFAVQAHRAMDRLRRGRTLEELLSATVQEVRGLTGFDRVMAYRFRHDASGDVVAEARDEVLEPYLHRRYPASDIPAQARRLYVANTLRLIASVPSTPVPVTGTTGEPLDMSHCVLRSVSPVHIEYLTNMGVQASMSVSIVVNGQLWGMLACHHMTPRHVPYGVRMACDVLAQVLAARVQSLQAADHATRTASAATLRSRMVEALLVSEDSLPALSPFVAEVAAVFGAGAVVVADAGRTAVHGDVPEQAVRALLNWLDAADLSAAGGFVAASGQSVYPPEVAVALGAWVGVLALRFDALGPGWLVVLRQEQIQTIAWGGRPEKNYVPGPLGPRLTPRGSFDVWRETVRGTAVPWDATDLQVGRQLLDELGRASSVRQAELARARNQLLAVLGHDLRNPLQAISMTSHLLARGSEDSAKMGRRIQSATGRMQRLIAEVLDMSRLQSGLGLGFDFQDAELTELVRAVVDEIRAAHAGTVVDTLLPASLRADVDADRFAQLLGNLLSNARHHGEPGKPVAVQVRLDGSDVVLAVCNASPPIPEDAAAQLFTPFKKQSTANPRNKGGLGLGLYIAQEIVRGHGGTLEYRYEAPQVVFTARFPQRRG